MLIHNKYKIYAIYIKNISLRKIEEINWCIKPTLLKIHVQVVSDPLNNLFKFLLPVSFGQSAKINLWSIAQKKIKFTS